MSKPNADVRLVDEIKKETAPALPTKMSREDFLTLKLAQSEAALADERAERMRERFAIVQADLMKRYQIADRANVKDDLTIERAK